MSPSSTTPVRDPDVVSVPRRIIDAWADNDADAFAEICTEDGRLSLPGDTYRKGREEIRAFMRKGYAGPYKGTRVYGEPVDMQMVGEGVVLLVTVGGVLAPGETTVAPERAIRAFWLLAKRDGKWLISAYQNTPVGSA
jgi:uncharacterized protein (TIGR02246 family)